MCTFMYVLYTLTKGLNLKKKKHKENAYTEFSAKYKRTFKQTEVLNTEG